jgi:hypothetical protein
MQQGRCHGSRNPAPFAGFFELSSPKTPQLCRGRPRIADDHINGLLICFAVFGWNALRDIVRHSLDPFILAFVADLMVVGIFSLIAVTFLG